MNWLVHLWWWFQYFTGTDNTSGRPYGFWSGFGSDIAELAIVGGLVRMARTHNCHVHWCPRIGKHEVKGTPYKVCRRHHPDMPQGQVTYLHVVKAHKKAKTLDN